MCLAHQHAQLITPVQGLRQPHSQALHDSYLQNYVLQLQISRNLQLQSPSIGLATASSTNENAEALQAPGNLHNLLLQTFLPLINRIMRNGQRVTLCRLCVHVTLMAPSPSSGDLRCFDIGCKQTSYGLWQYSVQAGIYNFLRERKG